MAAQLRPISLAKFLDVIHLMEGSVIPFPDGTITIWAYKGSGPYPGTKGPQVTVADRPSNELVTVSEMESVLNHLRYSIPIFMQYADQCQDRAPAKSDEVPKGADKI